MITASALLAADKVLNEETVRPGLIGLFFFVALFVALYFLWRSMNKQLKKVDAHFAEEAGKPDPSGGPAAAAQDPPAGQTPAE